MNEKDEKKIKDEAHASTASKIDAIKELIFGDNIQTYDSEFESIKNNLATAKQESEDVIDSIRKELNKTIDNLNTDLNIRVTDLENKLNQQIENLDKKKVDRKLLGKLLISLGDKISQE